MRLQSFACFLLAAALLAQPASGGLREEMKRRNDALVAAGYNFTYGLRIGKAPLRLDLLVPDDEEPHTLSFWMAVTGGEASARLLDKDGKALFVWAGSSGELEVSRHLPVGACRLEVDAPAGVEGFAELGVKGPLMPACALDPAAQEIAPETQAGFRWPYLLFRPSRIRASCLLVVPDNTGFATEDLALLRADGACELQHYRGLAERLGCPVLVPLFPRPAEGEGNLYLHALTRAALQAENPAWRRVDLQLIAMMDDARARLAKDGAPMGPRALVSGFSASGSFANRFALLHPDRVLAAACGSPGGWPTAPAAKAGDDALPYPVGLADAKALTGHAVDTSALKRVAFFFYLGDQDANDAVPFRDSFSEADQALVFRRFGATPVSRWKAAEALYAAQGLQATFKLYPGAAHSVTAAMAADVEAFFAAALKGAGPR